MMKKPYMVEFELPAEYDENFIALIPAQRRTVNEMMSAGKLQSYALSLDRTKLWAVMLADSELEVLEMIASMPLCEYMKPYISELFFYNAAEMVMQFSVN